MGRAINKTVTIVELIKRRIVGLHQITAIQSTRRGIQKGRHDVLYPLRRYNHPKPLDNRSIMWNNGEIQVVSFVTDPAMCHVVERDH
ncbi:hypothetical protein CASFOL_027258 [Castilleja foliolosa]